MTDTIRPEGRSETSDEERRQVDRRLAFALGLGFAMVAGLVIRLVGIGLPPLAFHGARQLYDALMARGFWVDLGGGVPAGARAAVSAAQSSVIEPPLVQGGAALSFLTIGGEHLWPVRAASALLWVGVAPAVWGLVRRLSGTAGATAAMLVWLFLPFGVALSRSFQPDGPMLCFVVLALWSMVRFDDQPESRGQASVIVLSAVAVFLKPTAALAVVPALMVLETMRGGPRSMLRPRFLGRVALVVTPAVAYWLVGSWSGLLTGQAEGRFSASGLLESSFWTGWWQMADRVVGGVGVVAVVVGLVVADRRARTLGLGLVAGYLVHALAFVHHTPSHDYYHVLLLPPFLIAVGSVVERVRGVLAARDPSWPNGFVAVVVVGAVLLLGSPRPYPYLETDLPPELSAMVTQAGEAGKALGYSDRVLFVARGYGAVQQYYGYLAGPSWPLQGDLDAESTFGIAPRSAEERLAEMDQSGPVQWVLVTEPRVLEEQPDLARLLTDRFELAASGEGWTAYRRR